MSSTYVNPALGYAQEQTLDRQNPETRTKVAAARSLCERSAPYKVLASLGGFCKPKRIKALKLSPSARALYAFAQQAKRHDWPGMTATYAELAQLADISERTAIRAVKELQTKHVLRRVPQYADGVWTLPVGGGRTKTYTRRRLANAWAWGAALKGVRLVATLAKRIKGAVKHALRARSLAPDKLSPLQSEFLPLAGAMESRPAKQSKSSDPWLSLCPDVAAALQGEGVGCADAVSEAPTGAGADKGASPASGDAS